MKIVQRNCFLDLELKQVYLIDHHLTLKIKGDMMHFVNLQKSLPDKEK
jgi:hypothetical protein